MPKRKYMYCTTKDDLMEWYKSLFKKKELHSHFFFNRDYQNETKKQLLDEIKTSYSIDFLREDLDDYAYRKQKKVFKNHDDFEKDLKLLQNKSKSDIIQFIRCYVHPDDCKYLWKKSKTLLLEFVQHY
jgi:hypothetical protein